MYMSDARARTRRLRTRARTSFRFAPSFSIRPFALALLCRHGRFNAQGSACLSHKRTALVTTSKDAAV